MPGVSGAMLAINFGVYERLLETLTDFFNDWKNNLKFLLLLGIGGLIAIIFGSKILVYLFDNYRFITMMFFLGLIMGGSYNFARGIKYTKKNILLLLGTTILFFIFSLFNFDNNKLINTNNNIIFIIGGFIEIFASIVPGISATSLLMIMGIYDVTLDMVSNIYNFNYVLNHINLYFSYGFGMVISLIINVYLINYLIKKYRSSSYIIILALSIASILYLIVNTFKLKFMILELIIGVMLMALGMLMASILDK